MGKVLLKTITLHNFKGIADLSIAFSPTITRIYGENGSGKTTIKNAWEWLLGQNIRDVVPNINNKEVAVDETSVEAIIQVDDYDYKLKKICKSKYSAGEKTGNENIYFIDDIEIPAKNYLSQITSILSKNAVENIQILTDKDFFNSETTAWKWTNRRKILMEMCDVYKTTEHLVDDDKYILIREDIKKGYATSDIKSRYEKERKTAKENQLKNQALIEQKQKEINEYLGIDFEKNANDLSILKTKYTKMLNSSKKENMVDELKELQAVLYKSASELSALQVKFTLDKQKLESDKIKYYNEANSLKHEIETLKAKDGICPYCKQPLPQDSIEATEEDIADLTEQYKNVFNKFNEVNTQLQEIKTPERITELETLIAETNDKLKNAKQSEINNISMQTKAKLEEEISELERVMARKDDLVKWNEQIKEWKKESLKLADEIVEAETKMRVLQDYVREQTDVVSNTVNSKFSNGVSWSLYDTNYNGTLEENCVCLYNNKRYSSLSNGERNTCNIQVVKTLQDYFDVNIPLFSDNAEANTIEYTTNQQVIELYASVPENKKQLEFIKLSAVKIKGEK